MPTKIISSDSHMNVSHDMVLEQLPVRLHEEYNEVTGNFRQQMSKGAGAANQQWTRNPHRHPAAGRMGNNDPAERLKDMDADGVDVEVLYSELSGFRYFNKMKDPNDGVTVMRAFNDALTAWNIAPDRLVASYQLPIHDIDAAVAEVYRIHESGGKSLQLTVFPTELGEKDYFDERYDPLWRAITETDLPICCHVGLNLGLSGLAERDPTPQRGIMVSSLATTTAEAFGMWILTGLLERFPDLKLVFVETQLGWIPWYLHIIDDLADRQRYEFPGLTMKPSDYFRRNVHLTFIEDPWVVTEDRYQLGIDNIMWSTDYPHPVSSWPNSQTIIKEQVGTLPQEEQDKILCDNAARVWNLPV